MSKEKKSVSAAEMMAQLQRDPKYLAREREKEEARQARIAVNRQAAAPVVRELIAAGFPVNTVADLHNKRLDYPAAIPILLAWLPKVQNLDVKQDIVRCLSVPYAKPVAAGPLIDEFRRAEEESPMGLRWVIGNALEVVGDDAVLDDMIELATDRRYGKAREMLVAGLGNMSDQRVIPVLLDLLKDDEVSGHAIMALGKLKPQAARPHVEPFLKHPNAWVRKEAAKTIEKIHKAGGRLH
jgi:HEAT repeats